MGCLVALVALVLAPLPAAAGVAVATEVAPATRWAWPLDPRAGVLAGFDAPAGPFAAGHRGVDLAAGVGQPVLAAGAGTVAFAGSVAGRPVLSIDHPGGLRTTYEPVGVLDADVRVGDRVAAGAPVGRVTAAPGHCLPVTCLHWGLRAGPGLSRYEDPLSLLGLQPVRLLPVWDVAPPVGTEPLGWKPPVDAGRTAPDRGPLMAGAR